MPESLWQAAVELARQHGVYSVAQPLRLDYMGLKKRLGEPSSHRRKTPRAAFVELITPHPATLEECVITSELAANPSAWMPWNFLEQTQSGHNHSTAAMVG